jgi:hypothetical protein
METSRLAFGSAEAWTPLSNLFDNRVREAEQMRALREIAGRRPSGGNLVLVTHGSVVQPLTGIQPAPAGTRRASRRTMRVDSRSPAD